MHPFNCTNSIEMKISPINTMEIKKIEPIGKSHVIAKHRPIAIRPQQHQIKFPPSIEIKPIPTFIKMSNQDIIKYNHFKTTLNNIKSEPMDISEKKIDPMNETSSQLSSKSDEDDAVASLLMLSHAAVKHKPLIAKKSQSSIAPQTTLMPIVTNTTCFTTNSNASNFRAANGQLTKIVAVHRIETAAAIPYNQLMKVVKDLPSLMPSENVHSAGSKKMLTNGVEPPTSFPSFVLQCQPIKAEPFSSHESMSSNHCGPTSQLSTLAAVASGYITQCNYLSDSSQDSAEDLSNGKRGRKVKYPRPDTSQYNPVKEFRNRQRRQHDEEDGMLAILERHYVECGEFPQTLDDLYLQYQLIEVVPERTEMRIKRKEAENVEERKLRKRLQARRDSKNYREREKRRRDYISRRIRLLQSILPSHLTLQASQEKFVFETNEQWQPNILRRSSLKSDATLSRPPSSSSIDDDDEPIAGPSHLS